MPAMGADGRFMMEVMVVMVVVLMTSNMAFPVVEFSREGYKIRKVFG